MSSADRRDFLPAAGHDFFLPLYDPLASFLGFNRARRELLTQANIKPGQHILDIGWGPREASAGYFIDRGHAVDRLHVADPERDRIGVERAIGELQGVRVEWRADGRTSVAVREAQGGLGSRSAAQPRAAEEQK